MYVCLCNAVLEAEVRAAVAAGARDVEALTETLGVCSGCGTCREVIEALLEEDALQPALGYAA